MVFHVACPITCRRICFCSLGFSRDLTGGKSKDAFLKEVDSIEEFLRDPGGAFRFSSERTVQVRVPKLAFPSPTPIPVVSGTAAEEAAAVDGGDAAAEEAAAVSVQSKRAALQRKAAAAMVAAEDYARRFETCDVAVPSKDLEGEEHGHSNVNVMCRMCFLGENEGSQRARRMLSCKSCGKKYHRNCLKSWAQHRDLFHWSSWTCPSCRICEVCRRTGDQNKFMFCKRCDDAYHCYCQHPRHKNVSAGPYLCPKHTKCHSCGSSVPGNGLSVRWFLGYTCCDACGRLFVKGNYCPICLKVYRDSESTPMVCCDICQRWVHCQCDGISDEKYLQFQADGNLQYKCATCHGECYQVKDLEDAVRELWKRKDMVDRELIASLRAAAGLPTEEEIFSISPYSDDEENGPVIGRSLKFSLKELADGSPKKSKEHGRIYSNKKYANKKGSQASAIGKSEPLQDSEGHHYVRSDGHGLRCQSDDGPDKSSRCAGVTGQREVAPPSINHPGVPKYKFVDEVRVNDEDKPSRILKIKTSWAHDSDSEETGKLASKPDTAKAKKLVINLGSRKVNVTNSLSSEASNRKREQDMTSNGERVNHSGHIRGLKISRKIAKVQLDETAPPEQKHVSLGEDSEESRTLRSKVDVPSLRADWGFIRKHSKGRADSYAEGNSDHDHAPALHSSQKESRPLLKFKLKKPNPENQDSQVPLSTYETSNSIKGQRSKRKRPSPLLEKSSFNEDEDVSMSRQDSLVDEMLDASWILKKLGKGAKGKSVEIHQASDHSWHKGVVTGVIRGAPTLSVTLDDGRVKTLELGKQGVRFVPQKQKRSKT